MLFDQKAQDTLALNIDNPVSANPQQVQDQSLIPELSPIQDFSFPISHQSTMASSPKQLSCANPLFVGRADSSEVVHEDCGDKTPNKSRPDPLNGPTHTDVSTKEQEAFERGKSVLMA